MIDWRKRCDALSLMPWYERMAKMRMGKHAVWRFSTCKSYQATYTLRSKWSMNFVTINEAESSKLSVNARCRILSVSNPWISSDVTAIYGYSARSNNAFIRGKTTPSLREELRICDKIGLRAWHYSVGLDIIDLHLSTLSSIVRYEIVGRLLGREAYQIQPWLQADRNFMRNSR